MTELSPAAQVVLEATYSRWPRNREKIIAAALRAAADQMCTHHSKSFLYSIADYMKLHAIATELENAQ